MNLQKNAIITINTHLKKYNITSKDVNIFLMVYANVTYNPNNSIPSTYTINTFSTGGSGYLWHSNITPASNTSLKITGDKLEFAPNNDQSPKIVTKKHVIDIDLLYETVQLLAERLAVLSADEDILAKYPTLRDAYEQYQLLNNLINPKKKDE